MQYVVTSSKTDIIIFMTIRLTIYNIVGNTRAVDRISLDGARNINQLYNGMLIRE